MYFVYDVTVYYVCTRVNMSARVHEIEEVMDLELTWLPTPVILLSLAPKDNELFIWVLYLNSNIKLMQQALFPTETFSQIHAAYFSSWFGFYFTHVCIT